MSAAPAEILSLRRFGDDQIVTLAKLVVENAFQPIVEATTGIVFGYESLLRGFDRLGFSSPIELLDKAAETGHLLALEQMVNSRAFATFSSIPDFSALTLFVNLDSRLITVGSDVVDRLSAHLKRSNIPPSSICFEISERFDNSHLPEFSGLVKKLRLYGFKLAIDDFGVGHNGLRLLCDQPVDYLKIDRHFISGIGGDARKRHLVKQIVNTAHVLGTRVVAEGVETESEFATCRDLGCDLIQGWFVAHPTTHHDDLKRAYPHLAGAGNTRRGSAGLDGVLIRRQVEQLPVVYENDDLDTVFELFRKDPERGFFPVLNANDEPRGIISEHHVKEMIYHPFGRDLLKNRVYQRGISHFVNMTPIADLDTPAEQMLAIFADMDGSDCVILTENMRYAGVLTASSLLKIISEKQLRTAQDQNPLTGLPGNRSIRDHMQETGLDSDRVRHFCYCDFDNFKPFNDKYGFQKGDVAISLFAALMRRHFIGSERFLGHVGGDDFFISVPGWTSGDMQTVLARLLADFQTDAGKLYSAEDIAAGCIQGQDRSGERRTFPLMRCSITVLEIPEGVVIADVNQISTRFASGKRRAKDSATGLVFDVLDC